MEIQKPSFTTKCPGCEAEYRLLPPAESTECPCGWLLDVTDMGAFNPGGILRKPQARWVGIQGEIEDAKLARGAPVTVTDEVQATTIQDAPPAPVSKPSPKRKASRGRAFRKRDV